MPGTFSCRVTTSPHLIFTIFSLTTRRGMPDSLIAVMANIYNSNGRDLSMKMPRQVCNISPAAQVSMSPACVRAVQRMGTCSACQGLPSIPPCPGLCLNVMKGCLAHHYEVTHLWDDYIEALMSLSERLAGPFNVEMTIEPISIKISDAIMNFQESGFQVRFIHICSQSRWDICAVLSCLTQNCALTDEKCAKCLHCNLLVESQCAANPLLCHFVAFPLLMNSLSANN